MTDIKNMDWNVVRLIKSEITLTWMGFWREKSETFTVYFVYPITMTAKECTDEAHRQANMRFYKATKYNGMTIKSETYVPDNNHGLMIHAQPD